MPGRACRCTASASMLVARDRMPGAGRRGPAPLTAVEFLNQDTSGSARHVIVADHLVAGRGGRADGVDADRALDARVVAQRGELHGGRRADGARSELLDAGVEV